nr:hypothetical protein [Marinicella sp. W31]MDC2878533.1 hypothetical protein [Marinicella sp. W31]
MKTMIWVPIVLGVFKIGVLGTAMFFAIKSHYDGEKEQRESVKPAGWMHPPSTPLMPQSPIKKAVAVPSQSL